MTNFLLKILFWRKGVERMKTFNVTFTELKIYEAVIEAESAEKIIDVIKHLKRTEDDLVDKGVIINEVSEINVSEEQKFE
ncbi:TPA: hypothetical protein QCS32_000026 [Bacillus thuringiensis]|uniref:Uncharacterized protein n=2 Tax=root TaxID=1 RepID=A0A288WG71_9CAUD|nr:hypothetical protein P9C72_gp46 [Bacillus phage Negev_SA]ARW58495.1 hypothetical protein [Bacillus phage Negev_SA]HDR5273980.1 hypothetical protein [Bacillus thuringiensis]HDR5348446.1 hypothetical protein [Bacillus thuringiensis]